VKSVLGEKLRLFSKTVTRNNAENTVHHGGGRQTSRWNCVDCSKTNCQGLSVRLSNACFV